MNKLQNIKSIVVTLEQIQLLELALVEAKLMQSPVYEMQDIVTKLAMLRASISTQALLEVIKEAA